MSFNYFEFLIIQQDFSNFKDKFYVFPLQFSQSIISYTWGLGETFERFPFITVKVTQNSTKESSRKCLLKPETHKILNLRKAAFNFIHFLSTFPTLIN